MEVSPPAVVVVVHETDREGSCCCESSGSDVDWAVAFGANEGTEMVAISVAPINGWVLIFIPAGVVITPSFDGDVAIASMIFSLGFHFLRDSLRPLVGDKGDPSPSLLVGPDGVSPQENASFSTTGDFWADSAAEASSGLLDPVVFAEVATVVATVAVAVPCPGPSGFFSIFSPLMSVLGADLGGLGL